PLAGQTLSFALPVYETAEFLTHLRAPILLTATPGYPCVTTDRPSLLAMREGMFQGRCLGGVTEDTVDDLGENPYPAERGIDDQLPIMNHPASRPLIFTFSQNLKADSVRLASSCLARGSVRVERITSLGLCETVPGRLKVDARRLEFVPDQPWREGELYRYVLGSSQTTPSCDGTDAICSDTYPLPLQTALLTGTAPTEGGPDIEMFFRGGADVATVFNPLKNLPTSDVNANMKDFKEEAETAPNVDTGEHMENTTRVVTAGLAQVGCTTGDCPEQ